MTSAGLRDDLQAALAGTYVLEREIGRGGMATVFLARDVKHARSVALKVLHPELANSLGPERFRREIGFVAQLQHPHILTVLDSGETDRGHLWFTMPYVEGESLRSRLARERQLPVPEAVRIAREIAQALDYAHRRGVVHRDIKPENILLTDGQALVADFGIARALDPHTGEHNLTTAGMAVGTPGYMSPEQAAGDRKLDARTDVYSLGAVLFEMLAGEPPYTGSTPQAVIAKTMVGEPPSVRAVRPAVPTVVDGAIRKSLALVPADRFGTAGELARALETAEHPVIIGTGTTPVATRTVKAAVPARRRFPVGLSLLALGFLIGVGVLFAWRARSNGGTTAAGPVRLAVLPFENVGDSADAYFADGLTDAVRGKLTAVPGLAVIAASSSGEYRHTTKTPQQIAQELGGVRYLLVGKVRWSKREGAQSRVQVSPALVDVTTGTDAWEQPFDAPLTDVFQVQGDIAGRVVQSLGVALNAGARQTLAERPTDNLAAYDAYLKGDEAAGGFGSDAAALNRAVTLYERAIALDSNFAPAWAKLAVAQSTMYFSGSPSPERAEATRRAAERARFLAPDRPESYWAQGLYYQNVLNDNRRALSEFAAGLQKAPSNAPLLTASALTEQTLGRWDTSVGALRQAQTLDPRDVLTARRLATTYLWLRRYPEATATADRALALAPDNLTVIEVRAMVALAQGDLATAQSTLRAAPASVDRTALAAFLGNFWDLYWVLDPDMRQRLLGASPAAFGGDPLPWATVLAETYALRGDAAKTRHFADSARLDYEAVLRATPQDGQMNAEYGLMLAYLGRKDAAIKSATKAVALAPMTQDGYSGPYYQHLLVRTYVLTGEPEKALDALEPLMKVPYFLSPAWLKIDPTFAPLRGNPRFEKLVAGG